MIYPYSEEYAKKYGLPYEKKEFLNLGQVINDILPGFGDAFKKLTGSGLTSAEKEANEFSHNEAQLAYERELSADSTKHQREVQDLVAAGINPMLAAGASGGSVHSSPVSAVTPGSSGDLLGSLLSFAIQSKNLGIQRMLADQQISESKTREANINADTRNKEESNRLIVTQADIAESTKDAVIEASSLRNALDRSKIREVESTCDKISAEIGKLVAETDNELSKKFLIDAQTWLAKANAYQITALLPYQKQLLSAQTEEAKAAAALSFAHTAYQNKLIDDGYVDAFISNMKFEASSAESSAIANALKTALRTGDYSKLNELGVETPVKGWIAKDFMQDATILLDNLNPLNNIFK